MTDRPENGGSKTPRMKRGEASTENQLSKKRGFRNCKGVPMNNSLEDEGNRDVDRKRLSTEREESSEDTVG